MCSVPFASLSSFWIGSEKSWVEGVLTRAKARSFLDKAFRGFENPLPRTESPGLAQFFRSLFRAYSSSSLMAGDNRAEDFLCLAIASSTPLRKLSDSGAE